MGVTRCRTLLGLAAAALVLAGCGSSGAPFSGTPTTSAAAPPTTTAASPGPSARDGSATTAPLVTCASQARHTFIRLVGVTANADGTLSITANPSTMICGGPDDYHYDTSSKVVTARTTRGARIEVFETETMQREPIDPSALPGYLQHDTGTKIFMVTGPLSAISALQEQFHP